MTPRAYLCDLDGTLYRSSSMKWLMAAELALFAPLQMGRLQAFRRTHERLREEQRATPEIEFSPSPFDEQLRRSAKSLLMDESTLRAQVMEWMVHRPGKWIARSRRTDLLEELVAFHEQGGKLAVVSDYPARAKLDALGISSLFDVVVASGEHQQLRRLKPAPDGYLLAASELGVSPEDCVVLGDRLDADGQAAEHAGMKFRWIR